MPTGIVKFFNAAKGFGFITSDAGGKDIFVPSASLSASGIAALKPGQRLTFEELPDAKGPKAVQLTLLAEAPRPAIVKEQPRAAPKAEAKRQLTYYHDHTSEWSSHVLAEIRALGHEPAVVEYLETPPSKDELRTLARLIRSSGQSLVRKYEPLFLELRLDDRFIGDNEFWEAIVENPALINGPLLATEAKVGLCHTDDAVAAFFAAAPAGAEAPIAKPKGLSARALQILAGNAVPPLSKVAETAKVEVIAAKEAAAPGKASIAVLRQDPPAAKPQAAAVVPEPPKTRAVVQPKAKVQAKPQAKPKAVVVAKKAPKAKAIAKPKPKPAGPVKKAAKRR